MNSASSQSHTSGSSRYPAGRRETTRPATAEPPGANTVTSWPRRASSAARSPTMSSTDPLRGGGTAVRCVETRAIFIGSRASEPRPREQTLQHRLRLEIRGRDLARRPAVALVVPLDRVHRGENVVHGAPPEASGAGGQRAAEAGILGDDRSAGGEITRAAIAEPSGPGPHVLVLRHRELRPGAGDVRPVVVHRLRYGERARDPPAVFPQEPFDAFVHAQGDLERAGAPAGQIDDLHELAALGPVVPLPAIGDLLPGGILPGGDAGVPAAAVPRRAVPEIQHDRLPRRLPVETLDRHGAIGGAQILPEGEMILVSGEVPDGLLVPLRHLDLEGERIRFDVDPEGTRPVLFPDLLPGDVEQDVGLPIQPPDGLGGHSVAPAAGVIPPERPAILEAVPLQDRGHRCDVAARVGGEVVAAGIVDPLAGILGVIHVVSEALESDEVVQELVGDAGQRVPEQDPGHHHTGFRRARALHRGLYAEPAAAATAASWPRPRWRLAYSWPRANSPGD